MSLEVGGRADKLGNSYENSFLAKELLRLLNEKIASIEVEPLGEEGEGVEFISTGIDGVKRYYQCKASNGNNLKWTISDLEKVDFFKHAKNHILSGDKNEYHFISPINYCEINELCNRARRNHSENDYVEYQLSNESLKKAFNNVARKFLLDPKDQNELKMLIHILSNCHFETVMDGCRSRIDFEEKIGVCLYGNTETIRVVLENCVNDNRWYGVKIMPNRLTKYLEKQGFRFRDLGDADRVIPKIVELNSIDWPVYQPVNNSLMHRSIVEEVIKCIKKSESIILHGKAGSGKSGCVELLKRYLDKNSIPNLCIKLDKVEPTLNVNEFGENLGLGMSPILALQKIAGNELNVLILDQLDALQSGNLGANQVLNVCKKMIKQVSDTNDCCGKRTVIIFVSRTFDYKNDNGIKELFLKNENNRIIWKEIEVDIFSEEEVKNIIGLEKYNSLSKRLKLLLHIPSNLYVWSKINNSQEVIDVTNVKQLLDKWYEQICLCLSKKGISSSDVDKVINDIACSMGDLGQLSVPENLYIDKINIIKILCSLGLLNVNAGRIFFVHQSFLDYFLSRELIQNIIRGNDLTQFYTVLNEQTPNLRYRFLVVLQGLCELSDNIFLKQCEKVLESKTIRYYYKCAIWETIAKIINPSKRVLEFVYKYSKQTDYEKYIWQVVFYENVTCIKYLLSKEPIVDIKDSKMWLLQSINQKDGDFVVEQLEVFAYKNLETDKIIWNCLCRDVEKDSSKMFEFRMKLLENEPQLLEHDGFVFYDTFKNSPRRCIRYLNFLVGNNGCEYFKDVNFPTSDVLKKFSIENSYLIVVELLPALCYATKGLHYRLPQITYKNVYFKWTNKSIRNEFFRKIVDICKWALEEYADKSPEMFLRIIYDERYKEALVTNELILSALCKLPIYYANDVVSWLVNIFDYTGNTANFLDNCKKVIKRFSPYCSNDLFSELENKIVFWKEDVERMRKLLKNRVEHNTEKGAYKVYWAFWGHLQKELLESTCDFRLSKYAKELLQVLLRNPNIRDGHYMSHNWGGSAKFVQSPIASYAEKISDTTWLKIICTPASKMKRHRWKETENAYIEADHTTFAATLHSQALKQPERFAKLSLEFPDNCYMGYINSVLNALQSKNNETKIEIALLCDVIRKFRQCEEESIKIEILGLIQRYAYYNWPQDIIELVLEAIEVLCLESNEKETVKVYDLYNKSLNNVKCCAIRTMESLANEHIDLRNVFATILQSMSEDENSVVRFTLVDSLVDYYDADKDFVLRIFRDLVNKDLRTIGSLNAWQLLSRDYECNEEFYNKILIAACDKDIEDLQEQAAGFICALVAYFNNRELQEYIIGYNHSDIAITHIWRQAIYMLGIEKYKGISKTILLHIIQNCNLDAVFITEEVLKEKIDLLTDKKFILEVLSCDNITKLLPCFISYLSNIDDISFVYKAVEKITGKLVQGKQDYRLRNAVNDFIKCLMNILNRCEDDAEAKTICLNAWDALFKNNFRDMKSLDEVMDEYAIS